MLYEQTLYSLWPPSETGVLIIIIFFFWETRRNQFPRNLGKLVHFFCLPNLLQSYGDAIADEFPLSVGMALGRFLSKYKDGLTNKVLLHTDLYLDWKFVLPS